MTQHEDGSGRAAVADVVTSVTFRRTVSAGVQRVWEALTCAAQTPDFLYGFALVSTWEPLAPMTLRPAGCDGEVPGLTGQVLAVRHGESLAYAIDDLSGSATYLTWTLRATAAGCVVRLRVDETDAALGSEEDVEDIWLPVVERLAEVLRPAGRESRESDPAR
jgi:uncharacterized protein YndB with AHSA1/START domain